ncbi:MAG: amidohydrolase [Treponema sp.]|jgi:amidohydrolase|nr:amidohydrolase [Treponema sp.]
MEGILRQAKALEQRIIEDRNRLHKIPETGLYLPKTAAYVKERLSEMGIPHRDCGVLKQELRDLYASAGIPPIEASTGVVANIGSGSPCILLRADMDALPIHETSGSPIAADSPNGHMCGHDTHTAMLLGAARILKSMEKDLKGTVKLMFQPGEEVGCGALTMIWDGVLENPKPDAAMALHIWSIIDAGKAAYVCGSAFASLDTYLLKIQGRGGHSSAPHLSVDPLMICNQLYNALTQLIPKEIDPDVFATLNIGVVRGGIVSNVIPDTADFQFGFRTLDAGARAHLLKRIPEIIESTVTSMRGSYTMSYIPLPITACDEKITGEMLPFAKEVLGDGNITEGKPNKGAEDFCFVTELVPSFHVVLGGGSEDNYPHHNPNVVFDERAFASGSAIYANCAVEWLARQGANR